MTNPLESFEITTEDFDKAELVVDHQVLEEVSSTEEVASPPAPAVDSETEVDRLRAENEHLRQMVQGRIPKGVTVMTAGQSQRVDDMIKQQPSEYFNKDFMVRPEGKKNRQTNR